MLAFQTPETPLQFRMQQNDDALILTRQIDPKRKATRKFIYIHHVFQRNTPVLITVTAAATGTDVYLNGVLARSSPNFGLTRRDLNGGIVVANSPVINDSWSGTLRGIAIYTQQLTADQVHANYQDWTSSGHPKNLSEENAAAIYPFTERSGKVIHSQLASGVDLQIPNYYLVLYPPFLKPFWQHWGWNWGFWKDGIVNITGFIPFGFVFALYFSLSKPVGRAILLAIIFGCAISFFIEATQFYLPTRDSDSMDFINNTLGTIIGAIVLRFRIIQNLLARFALVPLENRRPAAVPAEQMLEAR
jgi:hypothetical protein